MLFTQIFKTKKLKKTDQVTFHPDIAEKKINQLRFE